MKRVAKWLGVVMFVLCAAALAAYADIGEPWETLWLAAVGILFGLGLSRMS